MIARYVPFELAMTDALVPMWRTAFEHGVGIWTQSALPLRDEPLQAKKLR